MNSPSTNENVKKKVDESVKTNDDLEWSENIIIILNIIRVHSNFLSLYHNNKHQYYKGRLKWFRIPIIILSAINGFTAVGLQEYAPQVTISTVNSLVSLFCGIITTVEMFLGIQKRMETELIAHKEYYILSMDIFKMNSLEKNRRNVDGRQFLDEKFSEFKKIIQSSNTVDSNFLLEINDDIDTIDQFVNAKNDSEFENIIAEKLNTKVKRNSFSDTIANGILKVYDTKKYEIKQHKTEMKNKISSLSKQLSKQISNPSKDVNDIDNDIDIVNIGSDNSDNSHGSNHKYIEHNESKSPHNKFKKTNSIKNVNYSLFPLPEDDEEAQFNNDI